MISEVMDQPGRTFQAAYQLAFTDCDALLSELAQKLEPGDDLGRRLLRVTLANYFAAAVMMPYGKFHEAAELAGYDIELLGAQVRRELRAGRASADHAGAPHRARHSILSPARRQRRQCLEAFFLGPLSLRPFRRHMSAVEYPRRLLRAQGGF